ncbi:MAG: TIGR04283 family arsenosugar biosynthesis glycosyltransferase [Pseudomonadota bacterium]
MSAPLSVIVPTLDAAARIGPCLGALGEGLMAGLVRELVIADGGSSDAIAEVTEAVGGRLITAPRGRGPQLAAGCQAAAGRWLLVVHADTRLPPGWAETVARHIAEHPDKAGYFGLRFDATGFAAGWVAGWANLRSALFALPYGDQALLVPADLYRAVGGYPEIAIMEDVALVRRIGRRRLRRLAGYALTSAERYQRDGWVRRGARNLTTLALWHLGADPDRLAERYRRR